MNRTSIRFPALFATVLTLTAGVALAQKKEGDVVNLRDGKSQTMTIDNENWDGITGKGGPPVAWEAVQSVEYKDGAEFQKAVDAFRAGNISAAMTQFATLKRDPRLRKIFKQQIAFDTAYATEMEGGKVDDAIAQYQDVMKTYPKGRYHVQAAERVAACMLSKGDAAGALAAVDAAVADVSGDTGLGAALGLIRARILMGQNKVNDAQLLYAAAAAVKGVPTWVVFEGQLGQAAAVQAQGNVADAKLRFQTLTKADASNHVLSGAWNGLGDILAEEGVKKKDIDQLIDATLCYLRGSTVYAPLAGESTDQYERSLAGAARCFDFIADLEPNKDKKSQNKSRAAERRAQLKKEFPNSPYLTK